MADMTARRRAAAPADLQPRASPARPRQGILDNWATTCRKFRKVMPVEYRRALRRWKQAQQKIGRARTRQLQRAAAAGCLMAMDGGMGKITGFLEIDRQRPALRAGEPTACAITASSSCRCPRGARATRRRAAWIAASPIVTPAARSTTRSRTGTTSSIAATGRGARNLHSTNNFPEFTGRICPAPCEASCTLNIDRQPVTIKTIECAIADRGWRKAGSSRSRRAQDRQAVAVVGSGPAGLACAQQLARAGHDVHVYEKHAKARRPAALRHPRLQDGEAPSSTAASSRWRPRA
jgi:hypothetical protein